MTRNKPKELMDLLECPKALKECWNWFLTLNQTRSTGFGASPITYTEMRNYFILVDIEPLPEEIHIIKVFDSIALEAMAKQQEKKKK
jgi:hypothetical protein